MFVFETKLTKKRSWIREHCVALSLEKVCNPHPEYERNKNLCRNNLEIIAD